MKKEWWLSHRSASFSLSRNCISYQESELLSREAAPPVSSSLHEPFSPPAFHHKLKQHEVLARSWVDASTMLLDFSDSGARRQNKPLPCISFHSQVFGYSNRKQTKTNWRSSVLSREGEFRTEDWVWEERLKTKKWDIVAKAITWKDLDYILI